jgi:1,2-diacylglycerol 3-beta-glucosyltransferase
MIISISNYQIINIINLIIAIVFALLYFMQNVHLIVGAFTQHKKFKSAKKLHKYAYFICARNEENVIGNLIDSIYNQDYPRDLMQVFVCADNCTDNTKKVSLEHGAIVYERNSVIEKGKCYALDLLIKNVLKDPKYDDIEAFFVFDADNLLSKDYTKHMNDTFDAGYQVSTSF